MKTRLMQIILFFPCCIIDGISLFIILLPMYIICGKKAFTKEPFLEWIFNLNKKD
jgi:hypothetical protein